MATALVLALRQYVNVYQILNPAELFDRLNRYFAPGSTCTLAIDNNEYFVVVYMYLQNINSNVDASKYEI